MDLSRRLRDELIIDDVSYPLNLAFNNVLKLFEMWRDDEIPDIVKPHFALKMLLGDCFEQLPDMTIEEAMALIEQIFEEHIQLDSVRDTSVEYDLAGNVMKSVSTSTNDKPVYDIAYDGDFIFASFMQAYGIDLFEVQGKLHWKKFNALLAGLPEGTKFVEVIKIRKYKPQKGDADEYKADMRKLQKEYALPGSDSEYDDIDEDDYLS